MSHFYKKTKSWKTVWLLGLWQGKSGRNLDVSFFSFKFWSLFNYKPTSGRNKFFSFNAWHESSPNTWRRLLPDRWLSDRRCGRPAFAVLSGQGQQLLPLPLQGLQAIVRGAMDRCSSPDTGRFRKASNHSPKLCFHLFRHIFHEVNDNPLAQILGNTRKICFKQHFSILLLISLAF